MFRFNPFKRKKPSGKNIKTKCEVENQLEISIGGILLKINRCTAFPPTNELTAIIPRAEIRRRCYNNGRLTAEEEIILNSITLVDSPRHEEKPSEPPTTPSPTLLRLP